MKTFCPYENYKDSDIRWLSHVPQHWEVKPLFSIAYERKKKNVGLIENNVLSLSYGKIIRRNVDTDFGLLPASFETYNIIHPENIVLRLTDLQNDQRSLRTGIAREKGIITSAYVCLDVSSNQSAEYIQYLLHAYDIEKVFYNMGGGVRQSMGYDDLRRLPLTIPTRIEQERITSFLNRETVRIDDLIVKKLRLIELLQEKRQAIITQAVTKGLNPKIPMKNSGVEWLGEVPEHWEVHKLNWHFTAEKGRNAMKYTNEYCALHPGNYPVYSGQTDNDGILGLIDSYDYDFKENGVIFATTVGAKAMTLNYLCGKFSLSQNCMLIKPIETIRSLKFYYYHLQPLFAFERARIPDIMQPSFRVDDLNSYWIALPPAEEREKITKYILRNTKRIDSIVVKNKTTINLLKERRSALIIAAVTGEIDVREEVA